MLYELDSQAWAVAILGALLVGMGKGGLPGAGNLSIILFAMAFPTKASVGILLPVLICADIVAIAVYQRHTQWKYLLKLLPWVTIGIGLGALLFGRMDDGLLAKVIGGILLLMVAVHFIRKRMVKNLESSDQEQKHSLWFIGITGVFGGIATLLANAAGPVVAIYLLAVGLPKYAFIGTAAWFFFIINVIKVPVQVSLNNLSWETLKLSMFLGIFAIIAGLITPRLVKYIPQKTFEFLVWFFIVIAGLKMLIW